MDASHRAPSQNITHSSGPKRLGWRAVMGLLSCPDLSRAVFEVWQEVGQVRKLLICRTLPYLCPTYPNLSFLLDYY